MISYCTFIYSGAVIRQGPSFNRIRSADLATRVVSLCLSVCLSVSLSLSLRLILCDVGLRRFGQKFFAPPFSYLILLILWNFCLFYPCLQHMSTAYFTYICLLLFCLCYFFLSVSSPMFTLSSARVRPHRAGLSPWGPCQV